jgi:proteasome lid subunit RPN8/RPN11
MFAFLLQDDDTEERCGLILKDGTIVEIDNVAEDRTNSYRMKAEDVVFFLPNTVATWHTHPDTDPNLSGEDYAGFLAWPDLRHHIIGRRNGAVVTTTYEVEDGLVIECS